MEKMGTENWTGSSTLLPNSSHSSHSSALPVLAQGRARSPPRPGRGPLPTRAVELQADGSRWAEAQLACPRCLRLLRVCYTHSRRCAEASPARPAVVVGGDAVPDVACKTEDLHPDPHPGPRTPHPHPGKPCGRDGLQHLEGPPMSAPSRGGRSRFPPPSGLSPFRRFREPEGPPGHPFTS